jgi:uncharacterized damage-inducible protein DinB
MRHYLERAGDEDLTGLVSYATSSGEKRERLLWRRLYHLVDHAMQPRSEAAVILAGFGATPGDLDFTLFRQEPWERRG